MFDFLKPKWKRANPEVRIQGIAELSDQEVLKTIAKDDPEPAVRQAASDRLEQIAKGKHDILCGKGYANPKEIPSETIDKTRVLAESFVENGDSSDVETLCQAASFWDKIDNASIVIPSVDCGSIGVLYNIIRALGKIGDPQATETLIPYVNWWVGDMFSVCEFRKEVIIALGRIKDVRGVPSIIEALTDKDTVVKALIGTVEPYAREVLKNHVRDTGLKEDDVSKEISYSLVNSCIRKTAAETLGLIGDKRAVDSLRKAKQDSDAEVREAATEALRQIESMN
jgi:HEAT repeats